MASEASPRSITGWRLAYVLASLFTGLSFAGCSSEQGWLFDTPITVEIIGPELTYTLRAPFGAFLISRNSDVDYANRSVSGLTSTRMYWNFDSGEPLWLWLEKQGKPLNDTSEVYLNAQILTTLASNDTAQIAKKVYFEDNLKRSFPEQVPKLQRKVWNNTASEYKNFDTTYYVIEEREPFDGSVIVCRDTATYCRLHGASVRDTLRLRGIMVYKEDVANWKQYQTMAQTRVEQAIVDVKPTQQTKPNRWLFWRSW